MIRISRAMGRDADNATGGGARMIRGLPLGIWALGFVSMLMDISSEIIHSLLPVLLTTVLGASAVTLGWIEGVAEATASVTKVFSGVVADRWGKRKPLALLGYGLAALTKPVFPLAGSVGWVFAARFVDRVGKGIRGAPRDALVAELAPPGARGAAFGLRQSLDSVGAFAGPLLAVALMLLLAGDLRAVLWVAVVPAFLAVALLFFGVEETRSASPCNTGTAALRWNSIGALPRTFWLVVGLGALFGMARFSEAFLLLRAKELGLAVAWVPLVLVVMNVVYAATAYPAGVVADRFGPRGTLALGLLVLAAADAVLAAAQGPVAALCGAGLWGLHMGLTQGIMSKLVADTAPEHLRGSAFGIFHLVGGLALLAASALAGWLWSACGPATAFLTGMAFALATAAALWVVSRVPRPQPAA